MKSPLSASAAVTLSLLLTAATPAAWAQSAPTTTQSGEGQNAHHSDESEAAASSPGPASPRGGMPMMGRMGGDMGGMMHGGGMMGGMPFEHVEGRLAFLKTELKITAEQEPQWNKYADAARSVAGSMKHMHEEMMRGGQMMRGGPQSAAARLDQYEQMLSGRLEAVRKIKAAFDPLYASLSDEQKKTADDLFGRVGAI